MFEGEQTNLDNFGTERAEKLWGIRRETLLALARELGADEANAENGIESILQMADELAEEFPAELVKELTVVYPDDVEEPPLDDAKNAEIIGKIKKLGNFFCRPTEAKRALNLRWARKFWQSLGMFRTGRRMVFRWKVLNAGICRQIN